jgi:hypothetical protein
MRLLLLILTVASVNEVATNGHSTEPPTDNEGATKPATNPQRKRIQTQ